ncbi:MAG: MFS transporter [Firmicutes bacterium]|nr:MFS transporter [Bacillota bacterium]
MKQGDLGKSFRVVWAAGAVSAVGDWLHNAAVMILAYSLTGSGLAVAGVILSSSLPPVFIAPAVSPILERRSKRAAMVVLDLWRAMLALCFLAIGTSRRVPLVYPLNFLLCLAAGIYNPAKTAYVKAVVPGDRLLNANSLLQAAAGVSMALGIGLSIPLMLTLGYRALFALNSVSFLISAILLLSTEPDVPPEQVPTPAAGMATRFGCARDMKEGLLYLAGRTDLRTVTVTFAAWNACSGACLSLLPSTTSVVFRGSFEAIGLAYISWAAGAALGAWSAKKPGIAGRDDPQWAGAAAAGAVLLLAVTLVRRFELACLMFLLVSAADSLITVISKAYVMKHIPYALISRGQAAFNASAHVGLMAGSLLAGMANDVYGVRAAVVSTAAAMLAVAAWRAHAAAR